MNATELSRDHWPWIAGRSELVRIVAAVEHDGITALRDIVGSLAGVDVHADMQKGKGLTWAELLDASHRALEATGKEIAAAATVEQVQAARLRQEAYERGREEIVDALLATAHNVLKRHPDDAGWLAGYGRRKVAGELEAIRPEEWEAGTPDWQGWRLALPDGSTIHGVRLVYLRDAPVDVWALVRSELKGEPDSPASRRGARKRAAQATVDEWMRQRAASWPTDSPPPAFEDCWKAAQVEFGGAVIRDQVRDARRNPDLTPEAWRTGKPGPRSAPQ